MGLIQLEKYRATYYRCHPVKLIMAGCWNSASVHDPNRRSGRPKILGICSSQLKQHFDPLFVTFQAWAFFLYLLSHSIVIGIATLLVGEMREVVKLDVSARWNWKLCGAENLGTPLFWWFFPEKSQTLQFFAILSLFQTSTHSIMLNLCWTWLSDAIFTLVFNHLIFKVFCWGYDEIVGAWAGEAEARDGFSMKFKYFWSQEIETASFWNISHKHGCKALE